MDNTLDGTVPKKSAVAWLKDKAVLVVMSGRMFGASLIPEKGDNPVGRQAGLNTLVLGDPKLSKQHFVIEYNADGYFIRDCESKNGTWLNGKCLTKRVKLAYGDRIIAGSTIFRFFIEESLDRE